MFDLLKKRVQKRTVLCQCPKAESLPSLRWGKGTKQTFDKKNINRKYTATTAPSDKTIFIFPNGARKVKNIMLD